MIRRDEVLRHPVVDGASPVVLEYADAMLIILRVDSEAAAGLRLILDLFATMTQLVINFSKSTLVPMHIDLMVLAVVVSSFQCSIGSFLQSYLASSLSCNKLKLDNFAP
ncbi:hypothetical protein ZWY2020_042214 [Hordeum vulgare]|nr:hypothetical protein ZWY2020_042214 [Hordeum vulgare]